ncbi:MAG: cobalamin-dependent protein [Desulfobacteraceae bacterium]|jgi:5-methyltetrahydrofolate--homocysteine methyltransferase
MLDKLIESMVEMKEQETLEIAKDLISSAEDPLKILNACSEAMETVGKRFETGEYFLPQLILAGEMLRQISEMLKPKLKDKTTSATSESLGKVLIGTVKGDIHDIGKDIVTFMLQVNGFNVLDLGIDVPPSKFVDAIKDFQPQVVGMSCLLTLAFESMKETVEAIENAGLREEVKIMVGGGQVSEMVRDYANADAYGEDAVSAVRLAKNWIGVKQDEKEMVGGC